MYGFLFFLLQFCYCIDFICVEWPFNDIAAFWKRGDLLGLPPSCCYPVAIFFFFFFRASFSAVHSYFDKCIFNGSGQHCSFHFNTFFVQKPMMALEWITLLLLLLLISRFQFQILWLFQDHPKLLCLLALNFITRSFIGMYLQHLIKWARFGTNVLTWNMQLQVNVMVSLV